MRERSGVAHDRAVMPMRYGFADTLSGQLHFRACGAGPDIVLLPWLPASGRMYEHVMPHLARAGFRAIAFDLAGSGRSHKKCRNWTVQQYAADVLEACGSLHTVPYTVVGGRFSASVAVEMLLASPAQVTGAVLDGVPGLAPEELAQDDRADHGPLAEARGRRRASQLRVRRQRAHAQGLGSVVRAHRRKHCRWCTNSCATTSSSDYESIAAGVEADARGGKSTHDVLARLGEVSQRVLVMTSDADTLAPAYNRALERARNSRGHKFEGNHPVLTPARAAEYAQVVVSFARR